jgi:hypothetical protein
VPNVAEADVTVLTTALDKVDVAVPERIDEPIKFTAVPEVKGCVSIAGVTTALLAVVTIVPVFAGKVSVFVPATAGAAIVRVPDVLPSRFITPVVDAIFTPLVPLIITVMAFP